MTSNVEAGVTQTATTLMSAMQRHPILKAAKCVDMDVQRLKKGVFCESIEWNQNVALALALLFPPYWSQEHLVGLGFGWMQAMGSKPRGCIRVP